MLARFDGQVLADLRGFLKELNKREVLLQAGEGAAYVEPHPALGIDVAYFHPNRTRHDEIVWLIDHVYRPEVPLIDQILNSFAVKFYGPSQAVLNAVGAAEPSSTSLIEFTRLPWDKAYLAELDANLLAAKEAGAEQWGRTELRTSLQTAAKRYAGHSRWSNMIEWIASFKADGLVDFYLSGPTMAQAFQRLTSYAGIGNYYGYHANANLARCDYLTLNENEDFVVAGPGAAATLDKLYPKAKADGASYQDVLLYLRDHQDELFELDEVDELALTQALKPGRVTNRLTSFGCEITCCQFGVFERFKEHPELINRRKLPQRPSSAAAALLSW